MGSYYFLCHCDPSSLLCPCFVCFLLLSSCSILVCFVNEGHQGIFSMLKATLWGHCKFLLECFKGTKAMTRGHGGNRLLTPLLPLRTSEKYQACLWMLKHGSCIHFPRVLYLVLNVPLVGVHSHRSLALPALRGTVRPFPTIVFFILGVDTIWIYILCSHPFFILEFKEGRMKWYAKIILSSVFVPSIPLENNWVFLAGMQTSILHLLYFCYIFSDC